MKTKLRDSYNMLLWLDSPSHFGDARFVINTECLNFLHIAGFPPPAECYDLALKTFSVSPGLHRVPPTAEIITNTKVFHFCPIALSEGHLKSSQKIPPRGFSQPAVQLRIYMSTHILEPLREHVTPHIIECKESAGHTEAMRPAVVRIPLPPEIHTGRTHW